MAAFTVLALCVLTALAARAEVPTSDPFARMPLLLPVANYQTTSDAPFNDDFSQPVMLDRAPSSLVDPLSPPSPPSPTSYQQDDRGAKPALTDMGWNVDERGYSAKQYTDNWFWGCNGSPYRNGPGMCDDWKVGPIWDVAVDGMVLFRDDANLTALTAATDTNSAGLPLPPAVTPTQFFDQFDYGGGGRVFLTGKLPRCAGYQVQAGYEGIPEWNASIVYPKITDLGTDPMDPQVQVLGPGFSEQRTVHYTSSLQSGELNFMRSINSVWRPYLGVRYIRFKDEVNDTINQEVSHPPLPVAMGPANDATAIDMTNIFETDNNLIGFQIGLHEDLWKLNQRFSLEGFFNSGVYYNRVKRSSLMQTITTQYTGDVTGGTTPAFGRTDVSTTSNLDVSEPTDIAYVAEASLSGVCRLNRCVALRGGYQFLWIDGLQLGEDGFLGSGDGTRTLSFHGWHAGIECRR